MENSFTQGSLLSLDRMWRNTLENPVFQQSGFHYTLPLDQLRKSPSLTLRVFAVSEEGRVSELQYPPLLRDVLSPAIRLHASDQSSSAPAHPAISTAAASRSPAWCRLLKDRPHNFIHQAEGTSQVALLGLVAHNDPIDLDPCYAMVRYTLRRLAPCVRIPLYEPVLTLISRHERLKHWKRWGLSVSDAIRLLLTHIAEEKRLPFTGRVPNAATTKAINELESGKGKRFDSPDDLFQDLGI